MDLLPKQAVYHMTHSLFFYFIASKAFAPISNGHTDSSVSPEIIRHWAVCFKLVAAAFRSASLDKSSGRLFFVSFVFIVFLLVVGTEGIEPPTCSLSESRSKPTELCASVRYSRIQNVPIPTFIPTLCRDPDTMSAFLSASRHLASLLSSTRTNLVGVRGVEPPFTVYQTVLLEPL